MRIVKSLVGWLSLVSLIVAVTGAGLWVYQLVAPLFYGAALYELPRPNVLEMAQAVGARGIGADSNALLKQYAERPVDPVTKYTGLRAVEWIVNHGRLPREAPLRSATAIAVLTENGHVVSAYPQTMIGESFPFEPSVKNNVDSVRRTEQGVIYEPASDYHYPYWSSTFTQAARQHGLSTGTVYLNRVISPAGRTVGMIAVASPADMVVLHRPDDLTFPYQMPSAHIIAILSFVLYLILLPLWTGLDAGWRGMRPFAWGILVALTGWIGLLAYVIARLPAPGKCYNCGANVLGKYVRCPECGVALSSRCPICRKKMKPGWQYCPTCSGTLPEPPGPISRPVADMPAAPTIPQPGSVVQSSLRATVLNAETGVPIQDATILVSGPAGRGGRTNAHGAFDAQRLKNGLYLVTASKQGWESATAEIEMGENAHESVTLRLRPLPGVITGRVISRSSEAPVAGARVYLDSSRMDRSAETDSEGRFVLDGIPAGPYTVRAEAEGFAEQTRLAQVAPDQQASVDFSLEPSQKDAEE